jgi:hypothetical protein
MTGRTALHLRASWEWEVREPDDTPAQMRNYQLLRSSATVLPMSGDTPRRIRIRDTRFRNGASVVDCVYRLMRCFVSIVDGRTRSHFALVSRFARMIEVESGCALCGWFAVQTGTPLDVSLSSAVPSSWPPCSSCRRCQWWRLRHRSANAVELAVR